jgi:DNA-binding NarL/FixJ family response regulator
VGLRQILSQSFEVADFGEATTGLAVLEAIDNRVWDLLILDIGLPGRSGLEIMPELKQRQPSLPILILTLYSEENYGLRLLKAGAAGYLSKQSVADELITAVQRVLSGNKYVSPDLADRIAVSFDGTGQKLRPALDDRETRAVRMLTTGMSMAEVGTVLELDERALASLRRHLLRKLNVRTTQELVHYAIRHGLGE